MQSVEEISSGYTEGLKQEVSAAIIGGMCYQEACKKYGIRAPSTVYGWVKRYRRVTGGRKMRSKKIGVKESEALSKLEKEKREPELALSRMSLKVHCLEIVIEEAGKHYQEDLKKKFTQQ